MSERISHGEQLHDEEIELQNRLMEYMVDLSDDPVRMQAFLNNPGEWRDTYQQLHGLASRDREIRTFLDACLDAAQEGDPDAAVNELVGRSSREILEAIRKDSLVRIAMRNEKYGELYKQDIISFLREAYERENVAVTDDQLMARVSGALELRQLAEKDREERGERAQRVLDFGENDAQQVLDFHKEPDEVPSETSTELAPEDQERRDFNVRLHGLVNRARKEIHNNDLSDLINAGQYAQAQLLIEGLFLEQLGSLDEKLRNRYAREKSQNQQQWHEAQRALQAVKNNNHDINLETRRKAFAQVQEYVREQVAHIHKFHEIEQPIDQQIRNELKTPTPQVEDEIKQPITTEIQGEFTIPEATTPLTYEQENPAKDVRREADNTESTESAPKSDLPEDERQSLYALLNQIKEEWSRMTADERYKGLPQTPEHQLVYGLALLNEQDPLEWKDLTRENDSKGLLTAAELVLTLTSDKEKMDALLELQNILGENGKEINEEKIKPAMDMARSEEIVKDDSLESKPSIPKPPPLPDGVTQFAPRKPKQSDEQS